MIISTLKLVVLGVALAVVKAQENTCPAVTDCIADFVEKHEQKSGKRLGIVRQLEKIGKCGQEDIDNALNIGEMLKAAQQERFKRVKECIDGDNRGRSGFPECGAFPQVDTRECVNPRELTIIRGGNNGGRRAQIRAALLAGDYSVLDDLNARQREWAEAFLERRGRNPRQNKPKRGGVNAQCLDRNCGCPEAQLCHECYETSPLHDKIHAMKLEIMKLKLKCGLTLDKPKKNANRGPHQDESMIEAFST